MTRRLAAAVVLATSTILLGGCYDFNSPIDPTPMHALDPALLGTWRCLAVGEKPDAKPANFVVSTARDLVYSIRFEDDEGEPDIYEAHASQVKGNPLLNVRDLDPRVPTKPWNFARYTFLLPDVLRVQLVNAEALKGVERTPAALRGALEQLDSQAELYVDFCICVRTAMESTRKPK